MSSTPGRAGCACKPVARAQEPLGGNEMIIQAVPAPVRRIRGRVLLYYGDKPVDKAIVEVFEDKSRGETLDYGGERLAACMTGPDGRFRLPRLPPGKYLLRAGTSNTEIGVFNYVHVRVRVSGKAGGAPGKGILIELTAAT